MSDFQTTACPRVRGGVFTFSSLVGLLLGAVVCSVAPRAQAEVNEADRATARALAEEGHKALAAKDYALAEDRFRRADALIRAPSLMVDHARALVGLRRFAEAYESFDAARKEKLAPGAPAAFRRAVVEAERSIKEIAPKVAWVTLRVNGPSEPQIKIGEREIPASALGAPLPVDVGDQTIQVSAEGYVSKEAPLSLVAGQKAEMEVSLVPVPVAPPPPPPAPVIKRVVHRQPAPPPENKPSTLTYVAFGVGGAGLAVGAVTGILCLSERSKLSSECADGKCAPGTHGDDIARYHFYSYTSAISLLVGVAGAGTGVALLLTKPKQDQPRGAARVTPYVGLGSVGVEGSF